ncbi:MAG: glycosyltransferase family 4 protein [Crocinitomicaceae bacterium]|nr:glycosyltransferase family 4 protein [Crocinitomicaceae bacterium]
MSKKRILICIDWFEPGFKAGGPIRSVVNIVNALKEHYEFYILTSAYDLGDEEPYPDVIINEWFDQDGLFLKYLDNKKLHYSSIRRNILEINPDMIYLNSLFSKHFTLFPLLIARGNGYKVVLAPRGMLGVESLLIKKGKKSVFLRISKLLGMYKSVIWHATSEEEIRNIKEVYGKRAKIRFAQNIAQSQKLKLDYILDKKKTNTVRFVYMSRIAPIKNLHLAILAVKQLKSDKQIYFDIFGNIEDQEYFDSFKDEIHNTDQVEIAYKGLVPPADLPEIYANSDFLVLPTKHENYGHAIVEAWSNGCPVIISRKTPWKNLHVQDLGWDVDLKNFDNLVNAMQEAVDLDFASYVTMVTSSYNYFSKVICDNEVIEANRKLFADEN